MLLNNFGINYRGVGHNNFRVDPITRAKQLILVQECMNAMEELCSTFIACHLVDHHEEILDSLADSLHLLDNDATLFTGCPKQDLLKVPEGVVALLRAFERLNSHGCNDSIR